MARYKVQWCNQDPDRGYQPMLTDDGEESWWYQGEDMGEEPPLTPSLEQAREYLIAEMRETAQHIGLPPNDLRLAMLIVQARTAEPGQLFVVPPGGGNWPVAHRITEVE